MTRDLLRIAVVALAVSTAPACRGRAPAPPADPMLDAIRAEEREGNLSYVESQGKRLFGQYCATCHGEAGRGDGQNASNLIPAPPDLTAVKTDPVLRRRVITEGSAAVGRSPLSPPWGRSLTRQEIEYLVAYCDALSRQK
jgi:cbb3-type cytochrome c oxidase subunit III